MNRTSSIKTTSIAENCRSILRERYNHTDRFGTFPQQYVHRCKRFHF